MALSGKVASSKYSNQAYIELEWSASQDVANNQSTISWTLNAYSGFNGYYYMGGFKVVIDGSTVYSVSTDERTKVLYNKTIASGTKTLKHNDDGSKSFDIYIEAGIYTYAVNCSGSDSFTLNTIPREASSIEAGTMVIGGEGVISVTKSVSSYTHTIKYKFGNYTGTICTKSSNTFVYWALPTELANAIPNSTSGTGTLTCETYSGNTLIGTRQTSFTASVSDDIVPSAGSLTATVVNEGLPEGWNMYVEGFSKCKLKVENAQGILGSSISSYEIKQGSNTIGYDSEVLSDYLINDGQVTFTAIVTDSRGRKASTSVQINVENYVLPNFEILSAERCLKYGDLDDNGLYLKCLCKYVFDAGNLNNEITSSKVYFRIQNGTWSNGYDFQNNAELIIDANANPDYVYEVRFEIKDKLSTFNMTVIVPTGFTTMDFLKGGKGVAFGKVSQKQNTLECAFDADFTGNTKTQSLDIQGNTTAKSIDVDGDLFFNSKEYARKIVFNSGIDGTYKNWCSIAGGNTENKQTLSIMDMAKGKFVFQYESQSQNTNMATGLLKLMGVELSLAVGIRIGNDISKIHNVPTSCTGRVRFIQFIDASDNYYILIDSAGKLFTGCALNGNSQITWYEK